MKNEDKIVSYVYETFDYDKFKITPENRGQKFTDGIDRRRVKKIQTLIDKGEFRKEKGIVFVNKKFVVIDGAHTFATLKANKKPIRYIIFEEACFNTDEQKQMLSSVYTINKHNTAWTLHDLFNAALQTKPPAQLAVMLNKIVIEHKNTFTWNEVFTIVNQNASHLSTYGGHSFTIETFDDPKLIKRIKTPEFYQDLKQFIKINNKLRVSHLAKQRLLKTLYSIIYKASDLVNSGKITNAIISYPDNKLLAFRNNKEFIYDFIKHYNSEYATKLNPKAILDRISTTKEVKNIELG